MKHTSRMFHSCLQCFTFTNTVDKKTKHNARDFISCCKQLQNTVEEIRTERMKSNLKHLVSSFTY
jgi:hypothetical protein